MEKDLTEWMPPILLLILRVDQPSISIISADIIEKPIIRISQMQWTDDRYKCQ